METIAHRELRNNSSAILARAAAGESFAVTNHGTVAALIVPPGSDPLHALTAAGQVTAATQQYPDPARLRRATGVTSREIVDDLRGDR